jgi:hypothetical protein
VVGCNMALRLMWTLLLGAGIVVCGGCEAERSLSGGTPVTVEAAPASVSGSPLANSSLSSRQLILNAELTVAVQDIQQANQQVGKLVQQHAALVTRSAIDGYVGSSLECQWTIRVVPSKYDTLLSAIAALGESTYRVESSRDVTAEAIDLDARIRNKTQEESRLLKHLESSTGNLPEILLVEKELSRVREELERMQGQRNLLKDQVDWATITLRLTQHRDIAAAQPAQFVDQISRVWTDSWHALVTVLRFVFLGLLALLPWLVTLGVPATVIWKVIRYRRRVRHAGGQ